MTDPVTIDGSMGEGGGQILRSSLALSLVTGRALEILNIRARRRKPGLLRQHLTATLAAAHVGSAVVEGAELGSQRLRFEPGTISGGEYRFSVGTAGSATLVLQTILPALILASEPSELILEGGTHNPLAPPYDFLERAFLPVINRQGPRVRIELDRPGFYPAGGGRFRASVRPASKLRRFDLLERGEVVRRRGRAWVSRLPRSVGEREIARVREVLGWRADELEVEEVPRPKGPGNALTLEIECQHVTEVFTAFGRRGLPAEKVAEAAADEMRRYVDSGAPVGEHLADQLLLPLALAGGGSFRTVQPTLHTRTNLDVLRTFLDVRVEVAEENDGVHRVTLGKEDHP